MSIRGAPPDTGEHPPEWVRRVEVVPEIVRVEGEVVHLKDGSALENVDVILFATGYLYHYPFFDETKAPWKDNPVTKPVTGAAEGQPRPPPDKVREGLPPAGGQRLYNLDQSDIFYVPDRTLSFIALRTSSSIPPLLSLH